MGGSRSGRKSSLACDMLAPLKCSYEIWSLSYPYVFIVITWVILNPGAQMQISWFQLEYFISSLMYGNILSTQDGAAHQTPIAKSHLRHPIQEQHQCSSWRFWSQHRIHTDSTPTPPTRSTTTRTTDLHLTRQKEERCTTIGAIAHHTNAHQASILSPLIPYQTTYSSQEDPQHGKPSTSCTTVTPQRHST